MRLVATLLCGVVMLAGCAPDDGARAAAGFAAGTVERTLHVGGVDRTYRVHVPADVAPSAPLVVMLAGGGSDLPAQHRSGWDRLADADGFVVAYPQGRDDAWDAGGCCGRPAAEVAFVEAVVADVAANVAVNPRRVFAAGYGDGAAVAYASACRGATFAAIGAVAGTMVGDCPAPAPVSVIAVYGADDARAENNRRPGGSTATVDGVPYPEAARFWRAVAACAPPTSERAPGRVSSVARCPDGRAVQVVTLPGGRQWAGAADTLWRFFRDHPRLS